MFWQWTRRGYFSELNMLLYALLYREAGESLYLDLSQSNIGFDSLDEIYPGITEQYAITEFTDSSIIERELSLDYSVFEHACAANFSKIWNADLDSWVDNVKLQTILIDLNRRFLGDNKYRKFKQIVGQQAYIAMHIRRGDKLISEADYIGSSQFLQEIDIYQASASLACQHLYIASDDYKVFNEMRDSSLTLHFDDVKKKGHYQKEFNAQPKEQIQASVLRLVSEVKILCESEFFVGDYSSNIARYVALARGFNGSKSLGIGFGHYFSTVRPALAIRLKKKLSALIRRVL